MSGSGDNYYGRYWPGPLRPAKPAETIVDNDILFTSPRATLRAGRALTSVSRTREGVIYRVPPEVWGISSVGSCREMLSVLGDLLPVRGTPAGTGRGLLLDLWRNDRARRWHRRPSGPCERDLKSAIVGGRIERLAEPRPDDIIIDERSSYLRHFQRLPTGAASREIGEPADGQPGTWFARCRVVVPGSRGNRLPLVPIQSNDHRRWSRPDTDYVTWLWREEVELAREYGYRVTVIHGWSWLEWTTDTQEWCILMDRLKMAADSPAVKNALKMASSATIATFGSYGYRRLVGRDQYDPETDTAIAGPRGILSLFSRWEPSRVANMTHWYSHTLMRERLALFHAAVPYAGRGLVALHSDSVRIRPEAFGLAPIPAGFRIKETT